MALTPSTLRQDLKCGRGAISEGEKCRKGPATPSESAQKRKSRKAQRWVNAAQTLGTMGAIGITAGLLIHTASQASYGVGVTHGFRQGRLAHLNSNQRSVARSREQAITNFRNRPTWAPPEAPQTTGRAPASYRPQTERERKVHSAWHTRSTPQIAPVPTSPEPDVSAAFRTYKPRKQKPRRNPNPDVSAAWKKGDSVWARGFKA